METAGNKIHLRKGKTEHYFRETSRNLKLHVILYRHGESGVRTASCPLGKEKLGEEKLAGCPLMKNVIELIINFTDLISRWLISAFYKKKASYNIER